MASKDLNRWWNVYRRHYRQNGATEENVNAFVELCKTAIYDEHDLELGLQATVLTKQYINELILKTTNGDFDALEKWAQRHKEKVKLIDQMYDVLLLEAPYNVDSFKLYIERDRRKKDRFYDPRRETLLQVSNAVQDLEDDKLDILFVHMPPRVGKSGDITLDVAWHCAKDMELSNLYITYKEGLGGAFLDGVKEIYTDPTYRFKDVFPLCEIVYTDAKNNKMDLGRKKKYRSLSGKGLESGLNGEYDATGWMVIDDPLEGVQDVMSEEVLKRKQTIFDNNVLSRKKENCKLILMGTCWSVRDIFSNYLSFVESAGDLRYKVIRIPALNENDESNFNYKFKVGFTTEYYRRLRQKHEMNEDTAGWMAQYQQEPIERDGAVFIQEHMNYYDELPYGEPVKIIAHCDVALGGGDYLSFPIVYYFDDGEGNLVGFVEDVVFDNSEKHITLPQVVSKIKKHRVRNVHFEANQGGDAYKDDVYAKIRSDKTYKEPLNISSSWAPVTKRKEQRIWDNAQDIRELRFKHSDKWDGQYRKFMGNLFSFTMVHRKRAHEDAADSLAGLVEFERKGSGVSKAIIMPSLF